MATRRFGGTAVRADAVTNASAKKSQNGPVWLKRSEGASYKT